MKNERDSLSEGRPLGTCPICRASFREDADVCWLCAARRPRGIVHVTWMGGSQGERRAAREVLDLELNSRTFYGTIDSALDRATDGSWRVRRATIGRPSLDPNDLFFEEGGLLFRPGIGIGTERLAHRLAGTRRYLRDDRDGTAVAR